MDAENRRNAFKVFAPKPQGMGKPAIPFDRLRQDMAIPAYVDESLKAATAPKEDKFLGLDLNQSFAENVIALPGDTALEKGLELGAARVGEGLGVIMELPEVVADLFGNEDLSDTFSRLADYAREKTIEPVFGSRENIQKRDPDGSFENLKKLWKGNPGFMELAGEIASFMTAEGVGSFPDMAAMLYSLPLYVGLRTGEITQERKDVSGEATELADVGIAGGLAMSTAIIDRLAATGLFSKLDFGDVLKTNLTKKLSEKIGEASVAAASMGIARRAAKGATAEAGTEAVQEYLETVGTLVDDDAFLQDLKKQVGNPQAFEAALAGAIAGAGVGGALAGLDAYATQPKPVVTPDPVEEDKKAAVKSLPAQEQRLAIPDPREPPAPESGPAAPEVPPAPESGPAAPEVPPAPPSGPAGDPVVPTPVTQNGEQEFVAPVSEPEPAEDLELEEAQNDLSLMARRARAEERVGIRLRKSAASAFLSRAKRALTEKGREPIPAGARTTEKLAKEQRDRLDAARTLNPAGALEQLFSNLSRLTAAKTRMSDAQREELLSANQLADRGMDGRGLDPGQLKRAQTLKEFVASLTYQSQEFERLRKEIQRFVRNEIDAPSADRVAGALKINAKIMQALGLPGQQLEQSLALGPEKAVDVRRAIDNVNNAARSQLQRLESQGVDTSPLEGLSAPTRNSESAVSEDARKAQSYIAENQLEVSNPRVQGATAGDMYSETYVDEEGVQRRRSTVPRGSAEFSERALARRQEQDAVKRGTVGRKSVSAPTSSGFYTDYEAPGPQYIGKRDESGRKVVESQPVTVKSGDLAAAYKERAKLVDKREQAKGRERVNLTKRIKDVEKRIDRLEKSGKYTRVTPASKLARELRPDSVSKRAPRSKQDILERERDKVKADERKRTSLQRDLELREAQLAEAQRAVQQEELESKEQVETKEEKEPPRKRPAPNKKFEGQDIWTGLEKTRTEISKLRSELRKGPGDNRKKEIEDKIRELAILEQMLLQERRARKYTGEKPGKANEDAGVSHARRVRAAKVFHRYAAAFRKTGKGMDPKLIKEFAKQRRSKTINRGGLPSIYVLNPAEPDPKKRLVRVEGAYPRRVFEYEEGSRKIKSFSRATPRRKGEDDSYSGLINNTFYLPNDVEIIRGKRVEHIGVYPNGKLYVEKKNLPANDVTTVPEETDKLLELIIETDFDWDGQVDELAMLDYLLNTKTAKPSKTKPQDKKPKSVIDRPAVDDENDDVVDEDDVTPEPVEIDIDDLMDVFGPMVTKGDEVDPDTRRSDLIAKIEDVEQKIELLKEKQSEFEDQVESTPVVDDALNVVTPSWWPAEIASEFFAMHADGKIMGSLRDPDFSDPLPDGVTVPEALQEYVKDNYRTTLKSLEIDLEMMRADLKELDSSGNRSGKKAEKAPTKKPERTLAPKPSDDGGDDYTRSFEYERVNPEDRQATDLYSKFAPSDSVIASFLDRVRAFANSGPGGVSLSEEQIRGVAFMIRQWEKAQDRGTGGFLNFDGTGFGKTRQVLAGAKLITDAEAESGRNRPVLIMFPGANPSRGNKLVNQAKDEAKEIGIDPDETYSDGTPKYVFKNYNWLNTLNTKTEYAAAIADEAHGVKGSNRWGPNFSKLNTPFRAFFTATPTDSVGQETYFLAPLVANQGESYEDARRRLLQSFKLVRTERVESGKTVAEYKFVGGGTEADYLNKLETIMRDIAEDGAVVSRTYGRISRNFVGTVPTELEDVEASALYEEASTNSVKEHLMEHIKVPYMVEKTIEQLNKGRKVIAVFKIANPNKSIKNPKYRRPALEAYAAELAKRGVYIATYYGSNPEQLAIDAFQQDQRDVLATTDTSGSTGLSLNDSKEGGGKQRYMMVAQTSRQGERLLQALGRHDRKNNTTIPLTEIVRLQSNETDLSWRQAIHKKIGFQDVVTGFRSGRDLSPDLQEEQIYEAPDILRRPKSKTEAETWADSSDRAVIDAIGDGVLRDPLPVLKVIAERSDNPLARQLAIAIMSSNLKPGRLGIMAVSSTEGIAQNSAGVYIHKRRMIQVVDMDGAAQTFLHELVHHYTLQRVSQDMRGQQQLRAMMQAMVDAEPDLPSRFPNAFRNPFEFVAEAFTDRAFQQKLSDTFIDGNKTLSMFDRFVRWVQKLLGVNSDAYNALDRIVGMQLWKSPDGVDFDSMPLHRLRAPNVVSSLGSRIVRKLESSTTLSSNLEENVRKLRKAGLWAMTFNQIVDVYSRYADRAVESGKKGGNILQDLLSSMEATQALANKLSLTYNKEVNERIRDYAQGDGKKKIKVVMREGAEPEEMTRLTYLAHLMNISGYAGVHFTDPTMSQSNRKLKKDPTARAAWKLHYRQSKKPEMREGMKVYKDLAAFFAKEQGEKRRLVAASYLDTIYPDAGKSYMDRTQAEVDNAIKKLDQMSKDELKKVGAKRDALDDMKKLLRTGQVPGAYFPLRRYGEYVVVTEGEYEYSSNQERDELLRKYPMGKDNAAENKIVLKSVARFERQAEADRYREVMERDYADDGSVSVSQTMIKAENIMQQFDDGVSFSALLANFETALTKNGIKGQDKERVQKTFATTLLDMMPETSVANAMRERQGVYGSSLDIQRVLHNYGASQGWLKSNLVHSRRKSDLLKELNWHVYGEEKEANLGHANPKTARAMRDVIQAISNRIARSEASMMNLGQFGQTLSDVGFLYFLVGPSYNLVNATQVPLVAFPHLAARYGPNATRKAMQRAYSIAGSPVAKELLKTKGSLAQMRGLFQSAKNRKDFDRDAYDIVRGKGGLMDSLSDPNHIKLMDELVELGDIEAGMTMDMTRLAERAHIDEEGNPTAQGRWDYLTDWMRTVPHLIEVMNRSVTALTAFDLEYARSKDYNKAKQVARDAVKQTQFAYQNWNKPPAFQNPAGRVVLMFKLHVQHMYYYMIRNAAVSVSRIADPQEKSEARKALGYFILMHVMAAGTVGGTPELAKWLLGIGYYALSDDDEPWEYDKWMRNLAYDMFGQTGATFASRGLPGFLNMDLSGRIGIDSMLLYDGVNTSNRDTFLASILETAGGPMVSLAGRTVDGLNQYKTGQYGRMAESLLPKGLRDPVRAYRLQSEGFKDLSGKVYADADNLDWWDFTQQAIGFTSATTADVYQSRSVGRTRTRLVEKRNRYFVRYYNASSRSERNRVLEDIASWNRDNPHFAITRSQLIRSVNARRQQESETYKGVFTPKGQREWAAEKQRSYENYE